jgi:hypothetical protein
MGSKTFAEMAGDALREAAILVAVFGWLDRASETLRSPWERRSAEQTRRHAACSA